MPVFKRTVYNYAFEDSKSLPFIKFTRAVSEGGVSTVHKAVFHKDHHEYPSADVGVLFGQAEFTS